MPDTEVARIEKDYRRGLITDDERYNDVVAVWTKAKEDITDAVSAGARPVRLGQHDGQLGAKGNVQQIAQMAGMRGLMADPSGRIIELPIRSSFRDGLSVLEYFLSTHGARKGLADTAIRTADSGYLTRRLIDVAQNVIVYDEDCGTEGGILDPRPDRSEARRGAARAARRAGVTASRWSIRRRARSSSTPVRRSTRSGATRSTGRAPSRS